MNMSKRIFCQTLILSLVILSVTDRALAGDDFGKITKNIEKHYNAKKKKIPFLGLAGFFVKVARPAGVKNFKVAIYEDENFARRQRDLEFDKAFRQSISKKWKPMLRSNSRSGSARTYLYTQQSGKDIELLSVTFTNRQAIVAQAKVNPDALVRFMENPQIFGISLGNGVNSNSAPPLFGGFGGILAGQPNTYDAGASISTLRAEGVEMPVADPAEPPSLRTRSDAMYDPLLKDGSSEFQPFVTKVAESRPAEEPALKLEARLINLNVKATDRSGSPLSSLRKEDFKVFEEGVEQEIFYFEPVSAPINLVLLMDLSGSTSEKRKVMMETAKKFIDSLGPQDRVALAAFTRELVLLSDFSTDKKHLKKRVEKIKKIHGGTAFYDSMWKTLDLLRTVKEARQAIVVLTDGMDNELTESSYEPSDHSFEELLARVAEEDATIYPIYFNSDEERYQKYLQSPDISESRRDRLERRLIPHGVARLQLEELAEQTAGTVFTARREEDLAGVYERVASELRLLYTLAYTPKKSEVDGKFRRISVKLNREGSVAKTRRGYYAK